MKIGILVAIVAIAMIGAVYATPAFDQNKALKNAGDTTRGIMALSGTSPTVFGYVEFQQPPLKHRGLEEWTSSMQGYDYEDMPWSIRDFIDYDKPL